MKQFKLICFNLFFLLILLSGFKYTEKQSDNDIIHLDNKREIFVDHYLIDKLNGTAIVMHRPRDEGAVLYFDKEWEGHFTGYITVIKDDDLFRLYYRGLRVAVKDGSRSERTCYAESADGINWVKPVLGLFEIDGSNENNVLLANAEPVTHNFSPFIDKNPDALPGQKYKALGGLRESGLIAYSSPDGIRWEKISDKPVLEHNPELHGSNVFDSQNVVFWSESEKQYVLYFRTWKTPHGRLRTISRATSADFINWKDESVNFESPNIPGEHLYTNQTSPYYRAPHIYLAIGGRFVPGRQTLTEGEASNLSIHPRYFNDASDVIFMSTRGDNNYDRTFLESFIRPGTDLSNWTSRTNFPALNVVQTGPEEMSVYLTQDYAQPTAHLRRYSMRIDGFTSINAPFSGGEVITKPFVFSGKELEINYSTSAAGEITIEIQDINGNPIQGFTMEEAQIISGNDIKRIVNWKGNGNLAELASKPVRLRIFMRDADLYSLRFR